MATWCLKHKTDCINKEQQLSLTKDKQQAYIGWTTNSYFAESSMMDQRLQGWFCSMFFYLWPYYSLYIDPLVVLCSQNLSVITVAIDKFLLCFLFTSSSNSTDGQQTSQQSPPTVEVTPPDSQPEGNGVMEEQTDGERLYFCYNKYPVNSIIHWSQTDQLLHSSVAVFLFVLSYQLPRQNRNIAEGYEDQTHWWPVSD